jgi:hypothetical protein
MSFTLRQPCVTKWSNFGLKCYLNDINLFFSHFHKAQYLIYITYVLNKAQYVFYLSPYVLN